MVAACQCGDARAPCRARGRGPALPDDAGRGAVLRRRAGRGASGRAGRHRERLCGRARGTGRLGGTAGRRARRRAPALSRPRAGQRPGDHGRHTARERQGAHPRLRGSAGRGHPGALLRAHGGAVPAADPGPGRAARAHLHARAPPPARRDRHHRAVELPVHARHRRRAARAGRRQRRGHQAGCLHAAQHAVGGRPAGGGGTARTASSRWSPAAARSSARRSSSTATSSCSPARRRPAAGWPRSAASSSSAAPWSSAARTPCWRCPTRRCGAPCRGAVQGITSNSGQLCISIERVYVHDAIYDAFVPRLAERLAGLRARLEPHVRRRHGVARQRRPARQDHGSTSTTR